MSFKIAAVFSLLLAQGLVIAQETSQYESRVENFDRDWLPVVGSSAPRPAVVARATGSTPPINLGAMETTFQTIAPRQQPTRGPPPRIGQDPQWTAPAQWGPKGTRPFGQPASTPTEPQTIPTTTTEAPKEPVPFITTCGQTRYVEDDVSNALIAGCFYAKKSQTVAKSEFPKLFQNTQRFDFGDVYPPFYEFPIVGSAAFVGVNPGPDRVIFNKDCYLAGEITQTNAGTRGYTECIEEY